MKVKIQSPLATMTAELTTEQALAIYDQVLEWISDAAEDLDKEEPTEHPQPTSDPFLSASYQDRLTKTIEAHEAEKNEAPDDEVSHLSPEAQAHPMCRCSLPEQDTAPPEKSHKRYKGFLYVRCEHCGKEKGFNAKNPLAYHQCECGHRTELIDLKGVEVICGNCYKTFTYQTNINDDTFEIDCLSCQEPVTVAFNTSRNKYLSTGGLR